SVNRRNYRYDSLLTLRRGTPTNKRFSDTERSEAQTRWNVYADGYWHSLAAEPASRFRAEFSSRPHIRSLTHGLYHGGELIIGACGMASRTPSATRCTTADHMML